MYIKLTSKIVKIALVAVIVIFLR